jgi:DNA-binding transcriptional ArsR family regulator
LFVRVVKALESYHSEIDRAANLFGVLSTPMRLRILAALKQGEQNVTSLLDKINASQPNMSRHLTVLHQAGVVARRRDGQHMFYRIADPSVVRVCEAMCSNLSSAEFELSEAC